VADADATSFVDTGLQPSSEYYYRLCARNDSLSEYTPVASARTADHAPATPPTSV